MNETMSLNINDLVWAKMKGYCAWPGRIVEPSDQLNKLKKTEKSQCVYFFGSHNYAWIEDNNVYPYLDFKEQMVKLGKPKNSFDKAVGEIEAYMKNPAANDVIITPARKKSITKVRPSNASEEVPVQENEGENHIESGEDETPKKVNKVIPVKRSTQKKPKQASSKKKKLDIDESEEVVPAKRQRSIPSSPIARNHNNNNELSSDFSSSQKEYSSPVPRSRVARAVIDRPDIFSQSKPDLEELDVETITETLKSKNIKASSSKFGFIGLGIMGSGIVKNLINSGHDVCVYNRTHDKTKKFEKCGATVMLTPSDVVEHADITFSCVSDPQALKDTIFGQYGVASLPPELVREKGFVEMTTIDADTSKDIESALNDIGMQYLEAQIHGTKAQAEEGKLIILAAGNKQLFDSCQTCFEAMGRNSFFVGDTGNATKMNLVLQTITGITIAGLADSLALAEKAGLQTDTFLEVMSNTNLRSDLIMDKGLAMIDTRFSQINLPLQHMQKDLRLAINMSDSLNNPMPLTTIANEAYKNARRAGLNENDASAIYYRARH
ncbi:cytokine-like nuclear factor N-PAC [Chironomus tepperi]|uniref:cytokine-like nuclear factor N-PAC n=1 Tax=Chironomus tepperi TaxID=113505 RepID=UPI00391F9418